MGDSDTLSGRSLLLPGLVARESLRTLEGLRESIGALLSASSPELLLRIYLDVTATPFTTIVLRMSLSVLLAVLGDVYHGFRLVWLTGQ